MAASANISSMRSSTTKSLTSTQPQAGGPSHLTLFLTNLRLLDLDQREGWPNINALTFSTKDSQQNLKKRVQCVEWALYQLFALWDPEETRNKLQPFFPPLEHLQSLNLRAALFRSLDQVKKTGMLGRDAVLRKTMLDECKGERLEEVLCAFSTAVLKKTIRDGKAGYDAIAMDLALENFTYVDERTTLSTLILAHKVSLQNHLHSRKELQANYNDFANLLELKDRQITRRKEQAKVSMEAVGTRRNMTRAEVENLRDGLQRNWSGSDDWLESIMQGDNPYEKDGLFDYSFNQVFSHVEASRIREIEDRHQQLGLLEQLDTRVKQQSSRLTEWERFAKAVNKGKPHSKSPDVKKGTKGIDLGLGAHEKLQLARSPRKVFNAKAWEPLEEYSSIVAEMQDRLANVSKPRGAELLKSPIELDEHARTRVDGNTTPESISEDDGQNSASINTDQSFGQNMRDSKTRDQTRPSRPSESKNPRQSPATAPLPHATSGPISMRSAMAPLSPASTSGSPQASEILASMATSSTSPTKPRHVLSLAERTRMSMALSSKVSVEDIDDLPEEKSSLQKPARAARPEIIIPSEDETSREKLEHQIRYEGLVERTRASMSNSAAVAKNAQLERRRSTKLAAQNKRLSYMPMNPTLAEDDTPDKRALVEGNGDADYESVFKSRPKIKVSPDCSPVKAWGRMGGAGDNLGRESG